MTTSPERVRRKSGAPEFPLGHWTFRQVGERRYREPSKPYRDATVETSKRRSPSTTLLEHLAGYLGSVERLPGASGPPCS